MAKFMRSMGSVLLLAGLLFYSSCKKNDPTPIAAKAGDDQTASVLTAVTLDGSKSTGEGQLTYRWTMTLGPASSLDIQLQNDLTAIATFVPPKNGVYTFTLEVKSATQFATDDVQITVSGLLELGGTLAASKTLVDIETDPTKPDYKVSTDLIVPTGMTLTANVPGIVISVGDNVGIQVQGSFTTTLPLKFTSDTGWKGILLNGGSLTLTPGSSIEKAGKSAFNGQTESAAITATGGTLHLTNVGFGSSTGYDLLVTGTLESTSTVISCEFSAAKPIKGPVTLLPILSTGMPATYDYVVLTTPGASTVVSVPQNVGFRFGSAKYYIDGDFNAGSIITASASTIYMKAGAGIVVNSSINASGTTFDGLASAPWKGIAIGGTGFSSISGSFIKNAGSDVFNTGAVTTTVKAAVYFFALANMNIQGTEISASQGYGVYVAGLPNYPSLTSNVFKNTTLAAVSTPVSLVQSMFNSVNTFTMNSGVAPVEIQSFGSSPQPGGVWPALGGAAYYQFVSNVTQVTNTTWTLSPGVNLKFKAGKQFEIKGILNAVGTAANPITFDSEAGTAGTWTGIVLENLYDIEFCTIKNGGDSPAFEFGTSLATEKANVVFKSNASGTVVFKNNTISGSGGYGTLIESGSLDPQPLLAANNNTYTSNALGTSIKKP